MYFQGSPVRIVVINDPRNSLPRVTETQVQPTVHKKKIKASAILGIIRKFIFKNKFLTASFYAPATIWFVAYTSLKSLIVDN